MLTTELYFPTVRSRHTCYRNVAIQHMKLVKQNGADHRRINDWYFTFELEELGVQLIGELVCLVGECEFLCEICEGCTRCWNDSMPYVFTTHVSAPLPFL